MWVFVEKCKRNSRNKESGVSVSVSVSMSSLHARFHTFIENMGNFVFISQIVAPCLALPYTFKMMGSNTERVRMFDMLVILQRMFDMLV
jgi:hypothetical protein